MKGYPEGEAAAWLYDIFTEELGDLLGEIQDGDIDINDNIYLMGTAAHRTMEGLMETIASGTYDRADVHALALLLTMCPKLVERLSVKPEPLARLKREANDT